eukprot:402250_1
MKSSDFGGTFGCSASVEFIVCLCMVMLFEDASSFLWQFLLLAVLLFFFCMIPLLLMVSFLDDVPSLICHCIQQSPSDMWEINRIISTCIVFLINNRFTQNQSKNLKNNA